MDGSPATKKDVSWTTDDAPGTMDNGLGITEENILVAMGEGLEITDTITGIPSPTCC